MSVSYVEEIFHALVARYGRAEVQRRLEVLLENADSKANEHAGTGSSPNRKTKSRPKVRSAIEHVGSMDVPTRRKEKLLELARRFDEKSFLPTASDIKNLFYTQGVDKSFVKTRQASVSRVFFFLSSLSEQRLDVILNDHSYSGPSRLGSVEIQDSLPSLNVIQAWDGTICTDGRPMGEDGTALPWQANGPRAQRR